jgi:hypothetical protein
MTVNSSRLVSVAFTVVCFVAASASIVLGVSGYLTRNRTAREGMESSS